MRTERADGKQVKVITQGNIADDATKKPEGRPGIMQRQSPDGLPPMVCGPLTKDAWGKVTWRKPVHKGTQIVHYAKHDLCQIGYELTRGFQLYSKMDYRIFTENQTWLREQQYHLVEDEFDAGLVSDAVAMADVVILNVDHVAAFLHRQDLRGKKLVIYHHGPPFRFEHAELGELETSAGYGRLVSTPDLLQFQHPDHAELTWLPSPLNLPELDTLCEKWEKPAGGPLHVLHGFTSAANKGAGEFTNIVGQMDSAGENVKLGLIHLVNRQVSLHAMSQADVYFATYLYGPGLATMEAMAFGVPALVGCTDIELQHQMDVVGAENVEDLPWIYVTPGTTAEWLRKLQDPAVREHWAKKGRAYVEKFHSVRAVVKRMEKFVRKLKPANGVIYTAAEKHEEAIAWKRKLRMFD